MKQSIVIDVELENVLEKDVEDYVLVKKNKKWSLISKKDYFKETNKKIEDLENEIKNFKKHDQEMKNKIDRFEKALLSYGFEMYNNKN